MIRKAQYAGAWYAGTRSQLEAEIDSYMIVSSHPLKVIGCIAPHAGMMYSGPVAGAVYGAIHVPDTVIAVAVNHRGLGARAAIMTTGVWETPLGQVPIHEGLSLTLKKNVSLLEEDSLAHAKEHSLELHLPFLQVRNKNIRIVPVCLQHLTLEECRILGEGLAQTVRESAQEVLLVASSDMTHFESQESARRKDMLAVDRILSLDPGGLYGTIHKNRISMCGAVPATSVLFACLALGAKEAKLVKYATSGDVSGDYSNVVGYAGIWIR